MRRLSLQTGVPDSGGPIRAGLISGRMPAAPTTAEVLTDLDCEPDFAGVSHCRNDLRLADGSLSPGEVVKIVPA